MKIPAIKNWSIFIIAIIIFVIWQVPSLGIIRYPFVLLGTWFHEMGHGITALILGGNFEYLKIFKNGGGVAHLKYYSNKLYLPLNITSALVAFGGLIGPCIMGALLIITATKKKLALWMIRLLVFSLIISMIIWVRSKIGIGVLSGITLLLIVILFTKKSSLITWTTLFLGLQSILSTYLQLDYLFTSKFIRDGEIRISDTQSIANNLFGPYWFWAILIVLISAFTLWKAFTYYFKKAS